MTSLKSIVPAVANALNMSPAAIYERQRALVRAGLLESRPGRGPGSGVPATSQSFAMLLIAILATTSLVEVEEQTKVVANLKSENGRCPITGKKTFAAALTAVLDSTDMLNVHSIEIQRHGTEVSAYMWAKTPSDRDASRFGARERKITYNIMTRTSLIIEAIEYAVKMMRFERVK